MKMRVQHHDSNLVQSLLEEFSRLFHSRPELPRWIGEHRLGIVGQWVFRTVIPHHKAPVQPKGEAIIHRSFHNQAAEFPWIGTVKLLPQVDRVVGARHIGQFRSANQTLAVMERSRAFQPFTVVKRRGPPCVQRGRCLLCPLEKSPGRSVGDHHLCPNPGQRQVQGREHQQQ